MPLVSPDGKNDYVAAWGSDAVGMFARGAKGALIERACASNNGTSGVDGTAGQCDDADAMRGASGLAATPDGKNVYVASYMSGGIAEFKRDPTTGRLRQSGCVRAVSTCTGARGLGGATSVAVSPDGANVYLAAADADAISSFSRDPDTGALKGIGCISDDGTDRMCAKGNALRGADAVVVSLDGHFVYAAAGESDSVLTFARDRATGELTQQGCALLDAPKPGSCTRARGIGGPVALALAPDGRTLFVASYSSDAIAVFARNASTGALSERGCVSAPLYEDEKPDGCVHASPLNSPTGIAVSPDGFRVYVSSDSGLTVFDRDRATGGLRLAGCVSSKDYWDEDVVSACQLGRGVAGATGVAVSPDGHNVYLTASESDAVASFAPTVSMSLKTSLGNRRLTVHLACPSAHETPCTGQVTVAHKLVPPRTYQLAAGSTSSLVLPLPRRITRSLHRHKPYPLTAAATEPGRSPIIRELMLGKERRPAAGGARRFTGKPATVIWNQLQTSFCEHGAKATWCRYITSVRIARTSLLGLTTLTTPSEAGGAAIRICSALSIYAFSDGVPPRLQSVRVLGRHGEPLVRRLSLAANCAR